MDACGVASLCIRLTHPIISVRVSLYAHPHGTKPDSPFPSLTECCCWLPLTLFGVLNRR